MAGKTARSDIGTLYFDPQALKVIAGGKVFTRGQEYHKDSAVDIIAVENNCVRSQILGSKIYRAELRLVDGKITGHCSCPADRDYGFCKHLVATGLATNDLKPGAVEKTPSRMEEVRAYLNGLEKDSLIMIIMNRAERDPDILKGLELAAQVSHGKSGDVFEKLKKEITKVTQTRGGYVDYDRAPAWTRRVETVLNRISPLADGDAAPVALDLLDHFFDRMEAALENIDDSDGEPGALCEAASGMYVQACQCLQSEPEALAARLFKRETESVWDFFSGMFERCADILGKKGLAEYRHLAEEAWRNLPSVNPNRNGYEPCAVSSHRYSLKYILDRMAETAGDMDTRIALRSKDLSSAQHYLDLAQLCHENEREEEALKWAEEGLWQFRDDKWPDEALEIFTFDLYVSLDKKDKAEDLIWESFQKRPSLKKYASIKGLSKDLAARAVSFIKEQAKKEMKETKGKPEFERIVFHRGPVDFMEQRSSAPVILIQIFLFEKDYVQAWKTVHKYGAPDELLLKLAKASEKTHSQDCIETYETLVKNLIDKKNTPAYKKAVKLINRLKALHEPKHHVVYVKGIKEQHKKKRSLMKLMGQFRPAKP